MAEVFKDGDGIEQNERIVVYGQNCVSGGRFRRSAGRMRTGYTASARRQPERGGGAFADLALEDKTSA